MPLTAFDLEVLAADLPSILRRFPVCRRVVELRIRDSLEDLTQDVLLCMLDREARDLASYDDDRAGLLLYAEVTSKSVALQLLRAHRAQSRTQPDHWPGVRQHEPATGRDRLSPAERQWLAAYVEAGNVDDASKAVGLRQREGRAMFHRLQRQART